VALPQKFHGVINEDVSPGAPEKISNRKAMNHSRRRVEISTRATIRRHAGRLRPPLHIKFVKSSETIEASLFKERKEVVSLLQQPSAMAA